MTATTMTQTARSSGNCGCGTPSSSPCACGGAGCATCQGQVYVRPQFFAGQLLTEDDLQSLEDYVVAKNRLHTRYLFGAGVVCGLAVTCEPCGSGKVIVNPGYALDCCGNDIVVPCPQTLDINSMVHGLLLKVRGQDCGDPCPPSTPAAQPGNATTTTNPKNPPKVARRRYCLYIDYCEQKSDPVAPYAVNDPCGQPSCEPTRVREGFRFELRCPVGDDSPAAICNRFWGCVGDPVAGEWTVYEAAFLERYTAGLEAAVRVRGEEPTRALAAAYWGELDRDTKAVEVALRGKSDLAQSAELKSRDTLDRVLALSRDVARFLTNAEELPSGPHAEILDAAEKTLRGAPAAISKAIDEKALATTLERAHAESLREAIELLFAELERRPEQTGDKKARRIKPLTDPRLRYLARDAVFGRAILVSGAESLAAMRDWLIAHLDRPGNTHCTLLREVRAVVVPPPVFHPDAVSVDAQVLATAGQVLSRAVQVVLRDCFCNALLPDCQPCDDTGVLLACLTVQDCAVIDICNLERKFVLTGPNIRYWIPEIDRLGEALEKWCCRPACELEEDDKRRVNIGYADGASFIRNLFGTAPAAVQGAALAILDSCPRPRPGAVTSRGEAGRSLTTIARLAEREDTNALSEAVTRLRSELQGTISSLQEEIRVLKSDQASLRDRIGRRPGGKE